MNENQNKQIIISPYSRVTHLTKKLSPKNYPLEYWKEIIDDLRAKGVKTTQLGVEGEEDLGCNEFIKGATPKDLVELCKRADCLLSVDNWLPHFCNFYKINKNIVLFGQSDPNLFGYKEYVNLFVDKKYFRIGKEQFRHWENAEYKKDAFVGPDIVLKEIYKKLSITI